jgi:hypothetical protein
VFSIHWISCAGVDAGLSHMRDIPGIATPRIR